MDEGQWKGHSIQQRKLHCIKMCPFSTAECLALNIQVSALLGNFSLHNGEYVHRAPRLGNP